MLFSFRVHFIHCWQVTSKMNNQFYILIPVRWQQNLPTRETNKICQVSLVKFVGVKWLGVNRGPRIGQRLNTVQMLVENTKPEALPNEARKTMLISCWWPPNTYLIMQGKFFNLNLGKESSVQNLQSCFRCSFPDMRWFAVEWPRPLFLDSALSSFGIVLCISFQAGECFTLQHFQHCALFSLCHLFVCGKRRCYFMGYRAPFRLLDPIHDGLYTLDRKHQRIWRSLHYVGGLCHQFVCQQTTIA